MGLAGEAPPEASAPGLRLPLFVERFRTLRQEGQGTVGGPLPAAGQVHSGVQDPKGQGPHPSRKEAGQAQPKVRAQEGTPGGAVPAPGATVLLFSGHGRRPRPPVSHPGQPLEGAGPPRQARGRSPGAAGASGPSLSRPLDQEWAAPTSGEAGSLAVAGSQHPASLTDCFQHSEERLAPDSGVSEASFV